MKRVEGGVDLQGLQGGRGEGKGGKGIEETEGRERESGEWG